MEEGGGSRWKAATGCTMRVNVASCCFCFQKWACPPVVFLLSHLILPRCLSPLALPLVLSPIMGTVRSKIKVYHSHYGAGHVIRLIF